MRFPFIAVLASCTLSMPALADSSRDDVRPLKPDEKIGQLATVTPVVASLSKERNATNQTGKKLEPPKAAEISDNVQGLKPSDRRYRETD